MKFHIHFEHTGCTDTRSQMGGRSNAAMAIADLFVMAAVASTSESATRVVLLAWAFPSTAMRSSYSERADMSGRLVAHFVLLLAFTIAPNRGAADEIAFVGDEWPPFNGVPGSDSEGYLLDIVREIFEPHGHEIVYVVLPWGRAIREVEAGSFDALLGPFPTEAPSLIFPEEEVGYTKLSFFTRADSNWTFTGRDSLKDIRLGVIQDYGYRPWLLAFRKEYPENFIVVSGEDAIFRNLELLIRGRVDAIPSNEHSFRYRAKLAGVLDQIRFAGHDTIGQGREFYIAFTPNNPKSTEYAELLSSGVRKLRRSGRLAEILAKYELRDWKQQ